MVGRTEVPLQSTAKADSEGKYDNCNPGSQSGKSHAQPHRPIRVHPRKYRRAGGHPRSG